MKINFNSCLQCGSQVQKLMQSDERKKDKKMKSPSNDKASVSWNDLTPRQKSYAASNSYLSFAQVVEDIPTVAFGEAGYYS